MLPSLPRPGGRVRLLVVSLLLALASLLVAPAAGAAPRGTAATNAATTADRLTRAWAPRRPAPTWTPRAA